MRTFILLLYRKVTHSEREIGIKTAKNTPCKPIKLARGVLCEIRVHKAERTPLFVV